MTQATTLPATLTTGMDPRGALLGSVETLQAEELRGIVEDEAGRSIGTDLGDLFKKAVGSEKTAELQLVAITGFASLREGSTRAEIYPLEMLSGVARRLDELTPGRSSRYLIEEYRVQGSSSADAVSA